jgi:hypothetical protein
MTTLAQADGTRSKTLVLLLKGGMYLETGKHDSVGKGAKCPREVFSPRSEEPALRWYHLGPVGPPGFHPHTLWQGASAEPLLETYPFASCSASIIQVVWTISAVFPSIPLTLQ